MDLPCTSLIRQTDRQTGRQIGKRAGGQTDGRTDGARALKPHPKTEERETWFRLFQLIGVNSTYWICFRSYNLNESQSKKSPAKSKSWTGGDPELQPSESSWKCRNCFKFEKCKNWILMLMLVCHILVLVLRISKFLLLFWQIIADQQQQQNKTDLIFSIFIIILSYFI